MNKKKISLTIIFIIAILLLIWIGFFGRFLCIRVSTNPSQSRNTSLKTFDRNKDDKIDNWIYRDEKGITVNWIQDRNSDGREDGWSFFKDGKAFLDEEDNNGDGKVDTIYLNIFDFENSRNRGFCFILQDKNKNVFVEKEDTGWMRFEEKK